MAAGFLKAHDRDFYKQNTDGTAQKVTVYLHHFYNVYWQAAALIKLGKKYQKMGKKSA